MMRRGTRRSRRLREDAPRQAANGERQLDAAPNTHSDGVTIGAHDTVDSPRQSSPDNAVRATRAGSGRARNASRRVVIKPVEPSFEPPRLVDSPRGDRIDAVSQRIASGERRGDFRCDAVTHTLVVMLFRQLELATDAPHCYYLHPWHSDDELASFFGWGLERLRWFHGPTLFPKQPLWKPRHLRAWVKLWHGVDMIGRYGRLANDVVAETFQFAAPTSGKQKAWGAYHTPFNVCLLMATLAAGDEPWNESLMEPCVGAGSMIVAVWEIVREKLVEAQRAGTISADEAPALVRKWASGVKATDIDPEAAWVASAQLAVRTGCPVHGAPHPYRSANGAEERPCT